MADVATPLRLLLADGPALQTGDGRLVELAPRDALLLAWLAIEGATPRTRLAQLLWPDSAAEAARNALRQRLFQLKKLCGAGLVQGQATLALADGVLHDLEDSDDVLAGIAPELGAELAEWLARQRGRRRERLRQSLAELADMAEGSRDWTDALMHARELLALDPLSEEAHRRVMRLHYLAGDRAAALLAFDACEQILKNEVGARPSAETLVLLRTIEDSTAAPTPAAVPASVLRPPRLIGRDAEWQALLQVWQSQGVTLLSGEAGMGKTRVLGDLALREGARAVRVSARPGDAGVPYVVLARLLRAWLEQPGVNLPERHRRELARVLPELDPAAVGSGGGRALGLREAIEATLAAAVKAGLAGVLVDDIHFADEASIEALEALLGAAPSLAWVLAWRAAELGPAARALEQVALGLTRTHALTLEPLTLAAVAELVDSLGVAPLSGARLGPALLRHTGGNPLFLLETLKALHLQGLPLDATQSQPALPSARNVVQLISQRLARLSPAALKLARCAALAGQDFSTALATEVLGVDPLDLADAWAELEAAQVLRDAAFAHDLIHDAARATVPPALALRQHALIAQVLERQGAPAQRIAAHWVASDMPLRAVPCLLEASRQAALALRPDEARSASLEAADLLSADGRDDEALQALVSLLETTYMPAGEATDAVLDRMAQLARRPIDRARVAVRRADILARSGDFGGAGALAEQALAAFEPVDGPAVAARLLSAVAAADLARGLHDRAVERMHRAAELAGRSGDLDAEATIAYMFGSVLDHAHRYAEAYLAHRRAHDLALQRKEPMGLISVAANIAGNRTQLGLFDSALEMVQHCFRTAAESGIDLASQWPSLRVHQAYALLGLGEYTQAMRCFEDAAADIERYMPSWLPAVLNMTAQLWMHLGQWARARQAITSSLAAGGASLPRYRARALRLRQEIAASCASPPIRRWPRSSQRSPRRQARWAPTRTDWSARLRCRRPKATCWRAACAMQRCRGRCPITSSRPRRAARRPRLAAGSLQRRQSMPEKRCGACARPRRPASTAAKCGWPRPRGWRMVRQTRELACWATHRHGFDGRRSSACRPSSATASCIATRPTASCSRWRHVS
jgi:DNA-binding SARP family transcriptional activator